MRSSSQSTLFAQEGATSWSEVLAAVKAALDAGPKPASYQSLLATSQEVLAQSIDEPEHSAKVKKAEIAALLLGALEKKVALKAPTVLPTAFVLSSWTAGYKVTNSLGLALLEQAGSLDEDGWNILINALLKVGDYEAIGRIKDEHSEVAFDQHTESRIKKAQGALALRDMRHAYRSGKMPSSGIFEMAYPENALPMVRAIVQSLLDWDQAPNGPMPIPDLTQEAVTADPKNDSAPLFCSGFRWSGASAVYDFVKGLDGVGMPIRHPRIVSGGAAPLEDILDRVLLDEPVDRAQVVDFILEKILGIPPNDDIPKAADVFRRSVIGGARDPEELPAGVTELLRALQHYSGAGSASEKIALGRESMRNFFARITQSADTCTYTAYDSVMRAWRPEFVQTVSGARMIAVIRDPRDMYVTLLRMERPWFGAKAFIEDFGSRLAQYEEGLAQLAENDENFRLVRFEDFVLDAQVRQSLCDWLGVENTADVVHGDFIPEQSARNIGVYKTHPNKAAIAKIEAAFPDWCRSSDNDAAPVTLADYMSKACADQPAAAREGAQSDAANQLHVLSFSAMASKPMMEDVMSLSGKKGDPGWAVRKGITGSLIAEGKYDFVGLQHVQYDVDTENCGVSQILAEANARSDGHYDVLNADKRFGVESGDSLPLYYDTTKWELVPERYGVRWFKASDEAERQIGGGRFFVYGLFRNKLAAPGDPLEFVWVYNLRLIHKSSEKLDRRRMLSLVKVMRTIKTKRAEHAAPVVILADTNIKEPEAMATRYLNGESVTYDDKTIRSPVKLVDAFINRHPNLLNQISSQHNFKPAGSTKGTGRNDRILVSPDIAVQSCTVLTYNHDGNWPSYHFPIEAVLKIKPAQ